MVGTHRGKHIHRDRIILQNDQPVLLIRSKAQSVARVEFLNRAVRERYPHAAFQDRGKLFVFMPVHRDHITFVREVPFHQHQIVRICQDGAVDSVFRIMADRLMLHIKNSCIHFLPFDCSGSHAFHKVFLDKRKENHNRDSGNRSQGHNNSPVDMRGTDIVGNADCQRLHRFLVHQHR